jgi:alkanesulfonate monooxygenase SsuD/methylene tetrahydromethanopterin reductase-like flavin-dependent oxidoreductase (luciferase family)
MEYWLFYPQMRSSLESIVERAQVAERSGFRGMALMDHLAPPMAERHPMYDSIVTAAWIAAHTDRLRIGHLVLCEPMHHPAVLAKQAVALDHASGGRFELGIGSGSVPAELDTFGIGDPGLGARMGRLAESLDVIRALWTGQAVDYDGEFHRLSSAHQMPTPIDRIPIVIGGAGRRTLGLVAEHADWCNLPITDLDRLGDLRSSIGSAQVSVQVVVGLITDPARRHEVIHSVGARFGRHGDAVLVGDGPEIAAHVDALARRAVERIYVWFADFAPPETIEAFGAEVINRS